MSTSVLAAGIFAHESGQRLLHILLSFAERGFGGLYDKCAQNVSGTYYQTGLRRVSAWSETVIQEDVDHICTLCPDLHETFQACFSTYVADRFRDRRRPVHPPPSMSDFVRSYLQFLGQHRCLTSGDFFAVRDEVATRVACMDAARQALYALVTSTNVQVELASEVGSAARSSMSAATRRHQEDLRQRTEIRPSDSASQLGSGSQYQSGVPIEEEEDADENGFQGMNRNEAEPEEGGDDADEANAPNHSPPPPPRPPPVELAREAPASRGAKAGGATVRRTGSNDAPGGDDGADSVVSRHEVPRQERQRATGPTPQPPRAPTRRPPPPPPVTPPPSLHPPSAPSSVASRNRAVASSRDSSVSIGIKTSHSPRGR